MCLRDCRSLGNVCLLGCALPQSRCVACAACIKVCAVVDACRALCICIVTATLGVTRRACYVEMSVFGNSGNYIVS